MNRRVRPDRRECLAAGLAITAGLWAGRRASCPGELSQAGPRIWEGSTPPAFSLIPVVGDGRWIWREPPAETGLLEPREFSLTTRIEWRGKGDATSLWATTVAPVAHPEQELLDAEIVVEGCAAETRALADTAAQFIATAPRIVAGQRIVAELRQRWRLYKSSHGFSRERFPFEQPGLDEAAAIWLSSSPGIECRGGKLSGLAGSIASPNDHPWDKARAFFEWTCREIAPRPGDYTSVDEALKNRVGDCEERAGVFIALCRVSGIPARLVWVPNHAWAEFALADDEGVWHWIPAHTAAYPWFGWTGAHELVLQKGDRIVIPETGRPVRLLGDRWGSAGAMPELAITAELTPLGETIESAGPGARTRDRESRWQLVERHPDDQQMRV